MADRRIPHSKFRIGNLSRRNQMKADGNSFPVFILGWTTGLASLLKPTNLVA
jgi:hypothetical protein